MFGNLIAFSLFMLLCIVVGFCYLIAGPSLLAPLGGKDWFLSIQTASGPVPVAELLFLLLVGLLLVFSLQIFSQIARRQWDHNLLRRGGALCLGLLLWALIGYQGWLRDSAGEQQISWIQAQLQALPPQASPAQLKQALAAFFKHQPRLSVLALLPHSDQQSGRLHVNQDLAGHTFYEILTQFKDGQLAGWQIQQTERIEAQFQCKLIAEAPAQGNLPRDCSLSSKRQNERSTHSTKNVRQATTLNKD